MSRDRQAFSLIELLMVVAIVATLSALIVAAVAAIQRNAQRRRTEAILAVLRTGLDLAKAQSSAMPSPVEHPLAGSRPPRPAFVRGESATGIVRGAALDGSSEALRGVLPEQVPAACAGDLPRLLLDSDRFADRDLPLLYGMRRDQCTILGASQAVVTAYRSLPVPTPPAVTTPGPYTAGAYPDARFLVAPTGGDGDQKATLEYILGAGDAAGELARLSALHAPDPAVGGPIRAGRVHSPVGDGDGVPEWKAGLVRDGTLAGGPDAGRPNWKPYRLPGLAVYDAWGREVIYSVDASGAVVLMSAGADGALCIDPGGDRGIGSPADGPIAADDRDGSRDNVVLGTGL